MRNDPRVAATQHFFLRPFIAMHASNRFRTLSLSAAGARQRAMNGKDSHVDREEVPVAPDTLMHAQVVGDAIRWARRLLFRGVGNNARLVNCPEKVRQRALDLLSSTLDEIERRERDPWQRLVARCEAIARHGIGNCHECSELAFLYLVVRLPGLPVDQALYPDRDHVGTFVTSGDHVIRADPWTTVALPVLQAHGNKRLDVDLLALQMDNLGFGGTCGNGQLLRSSQTLTQAQRRTLQQALARLDKLTPEDGLGDKAILSAPAPRPTKRTGASMTDGSEWPLSKRRPVTALVCGARRLDLDTYPVNDYFHALFNALPRRGDRPFPAGCFDFADAIERLLADDPQPLHRLLDEHGFDAQAIGPLLAELLDLAVPDEPTRSDALRRLNAAWPVSVGQVSS